MKILDNYLRFIQEAPVGKLAPEIIKAAEKSGVLKKVAMGAAGGIDDVIAAIIYRKSKRRGK